MAGVLPAVLRRQVLQTQGPLLLLAGSTVFVHQRPTVLQPDDVGPRVAARCALQTHRAAHRASDDALPHLCRLGETWTYCAREEGDGRRIETAIAYRFYYSKKYVLLLLAACRILELTVTIFNNKMSVSRYKNGKLPLSQLQM